MMRLLAAGVLCAAALGAAHANGRPPATSTINFRVGNEQHIAAGMTFGLMMSDDAGATWHWVCEDAIGYGGTYDPDYVYSSTGALLATTFEGLRANRDGCVFEQSGAPVNFFSTIARGPDGVLHLGAGQVMAGSVPGDSRLYRSDDDGQTFLPPSETGLSGDWWSSIEVAPSDGDRVYASGYRFIQGVKTIFLYRSLDGGTTYSELPITDFTLSANSSIEIGGVNALNPDLVFAKVVQENNLNREGIYRSSNGGQSWARVYGTDYQLAFLVRRDGHLIAATVDNGAVMSRNDGATWEPLAGAPHINCLAENAVGEVWACTRGFSGPTVPNDGFAIMKSTDLVTWAGVTKFQDLKAPVACPVGTLHHDRCENNPNPQIGFCGLCSQLGCDPMRACPGVVFDGPPPDGLMVSPLDGAGDGGGGGCCDTGGGATSALVLGGSGLAALILGGRRRRQRRD